MKEMKKKQKIDQSSKPCDVCGEEFDENDLDMYEGQCMCRECENLYK